MSAPDLNDVAYGPEPSQRLDVVEPTGAASGEPRAAVILIHGGGWSGGARSELNVELAAVAAAGWVAINVDYRLVPRTTIAGQVTDIATAIAWVRSNATRLGVDPGEIALWGASAGGNLALLAAQSDHTIRAVVSWSAPVDLVALAAEYAPRRECTLRCGAGTYLSTAAETAIGCSPSACVTAWLAASPDLVVTVGAPPVLAVNSTAELVSLNGAEKLVAAWASVGSTAELVVVPGNLHATQYQAKETSPSIAFLTRELNGR